jgi:hypothetical protein
MTTRCKPRKAHPKCRPPQTHGPIVRLTDRGRWARDNGDPGLAFIGLEPDPGTGALIWVANCDCKVFMDCPVSKALAFAADRYDTATVERRRRSPAPKRKPNKR